MRTMKKSFDKQSLKALFLVLRPFVAFSVVLFTWSLPADYFDQGEPVCISVRLFDMECWGCGLTRSIQHLMHGEWQESLDYHPLGWLIFLLLGLLLLLWFRKGWYSWKKLQQGEHK